MGLFNKIFTKDLIYSFVREIAQAEGEAGRVGSRLLVSKKPDGGLDPRMLGLWPELEVDN